MLSTPAGGVQPLLYYCTNSPLTDDKLKRSQLTSVVSRRVVVQKNEKVPEKNLPALETLRETTSPNQETPTESVARL